MRFPFIDLSKAFAAQLIVLHHLAFYGPMSDEARILSPALIDWLAEHGRLAVQVFLVIGGYLAARSLASQASTPIGRPWTLIWQRYCRLAMPFAVALGLAVLSAAIARALLPLETTPAAPGPLQLIAHLLLLQNLLGLEVLSAGAWYVAIDLQLYALLVALVWLSQRLATRRQREVAVALTAALGLVSLFHFNRNAAWDDWGLYFFAAYAMGAVAFWISEDRRRTIWLAFMAVAVFAALLLDFRSRIGVAFGIGVLLAVVGRSGRLSRRLDNRWVALGGKVSYSIFLAHYPVCLLVNAAFGRYAPHSPHWHLAGLSLAWGLSIGAGILFHRFVEVPVGVWLSSSNTRRLAATASTA